MVHASVREIIPLWRKKRDNIFGLHQDKISQKQTEFGKQMPVLTSCASKYKIEALVTESALESCVCALACTLLQIHNLEHGN